MLRSFFNAITGLDSYRFWMDITADNMANVNTIGFKGNRPLFQDVVSSVTIGLNTVTNTMKSTTYGAGVVVDSTQKIWTIGNFKQTGINTDLAIQGRGLFILKDPITGAYYYTRDGHFRLSRDGYMVNSGGFKLQGFRVNERGETVGTGLEDMRILQQLDPKATSKLSFLQPTNLNADAATPAVATFDPDNPSSYNYKYSITIYDTLGNPYQADIYFKKVANNEWRIFVLADYNEDGVKENLISNSYRDGAEGTYNYVRLLFSADGKPFKPSDPTQSQLQAYTIGNKRYYFFRLFDNANPPPAGLTTAPGGLLGSEIPEGFLTGDNAMVLMIGEELASESTTDLADTTFDADATNEDLIIDTYITQYAADFTVTADQNGYSKGDLVDVYVLSEDGAVVGVYSNGKSLPLYRVGIAVFSDPEELIKRGANLYTAISTPTIMTPGGAEKVRSGMLEMSNVDIAKEFINLISAQRAYQANARVIRSADTIMDETINLVR